MSEGLLQVPPAGALVGELSVPGDKSISHRYAMVAAIADGTSRLRGYAPGADCAATLACLEALGARVTRGTLLTIEGLGLGGLQPPERRSASISSAHMISPAMNTPLGAPPNSQPFEAAARM